MGRSHSAIFICASVRSIEPRGRARVALGCLVLDNSTSARDYTCYCTYGFGYSCLVHVSRATLTSDRFSHNFCILLQYMANVSKANSHANYQSISFLPTIITIEDLPRT